LRLESVSCAHMGTRETEVTGVRGGHRTEEGMPYSSVFPVLIPNHMLAIHTHDIPPTLHTPLYSHIFTSGVHPGSLREPMKTDSSLSTLLLLHKPVFSQVMLVLAWLTHQP
jgi:hypothetical protein